MDDDRLAKLMARGIISDRAAQRMMTHQAEQPNPARPYVEGVKNFARGGLSEVLKGAGLQLPDWSNRVGDVLQSEAANTAIGMTAPLGSRIAALELGAAGGKLPSATLPPHNADIASFKTAFPEATELGVPNTFKIPMPDEAGALEVGHNFGSVKIRHSFVEPEFKSKGYGVGAYKNLADWALSRGLRLVSDSSVKSDAVRMYEALERRGYKVDRSQNAQVSPEGNVRTSDAGPAFEVTGKASAGIGPASEPTQ